MPALLHTGSEGCFTTRILTVALARKLQTRARLHDTSDAQTSLTGSSVLYHLCQRDGLMPGVCMLQHVGAPNRVPDYT